jgi:transposase-like protein
MYYIDLDRPMGSWRKGWREACKRAGVSYRCRLCTRTWSIYVRTRIGQWKELWREKTQEAAKRAAP